MNTVIISWNVVSAIIFNRKSFNLASAICKISQLKNCVVYFRSIRNKLLLKSAICVCWIKLTYSTYNFSLRSQFITSIIWEISCFIGKNFKLCTNTIFLKIPTSCSLISCYFIPYSTVPLFCKINRRGREFTSGT